MGRAFVLALLASLNPTLLAATTVMLILSNPGRLMLGYLLGAMMTSVTLGVVIVFSLNDTSVVKARLLGHKAVTSGRAELLLVQRATGESDGTERWRATARW